jgi:hypothetical protein
MKKVLIRLRKIFLDPIDVISKITVSVREAVREIDLVFVTFEFVSERKSVVILLETDISLASVTVLVIRDLRAYSVPACLVFLMLLATERQNLHAIIV